jgi:hypothetical protein
MTKTVVKLIGFDLSFSAGISVDDFFHYLVLAETDSVRAGGYQNFIIADLHKDYIVGVLLCYKGDKMLLATRNQDEALAIDKIRLSADQKSTQASVFCIDPTSKSGMFYSYHGGVSVNNFAGVLKAINDRVKKDKISGKTKELSRLNSSTSKARGDAKSSYSGDFMLNVKVREHDIETLISSFSDFSSCEISLSPSIQISSSFTPLLNIASSYRMYVSLSGAVNSDDKRGAIRRIYDNIRYKGEIKALKVMGKALTGVAHDAKIGDNIEHYQQIFLDDYIDLLPNDTWDKYLESAALEKIVSAMMAHPLVFPAPKPIDSWKTLLNRKDLISRSETI